MFKSNYTKWVPLGNYRWAGVKDYIVFARKNKKTGMIQFKTKRAFAWWASTSAFIPSDLLDVKKQWDNLISL